MLASSHYRTQKANTCTAADAGVRQKIRISSVPLNIGSKFMYRILIVISCFIHITSCAPAALDLTVWEMNIAEPVHSEVEEALESYGFEKTSEENQKSIYLSLIHI